MNIAAGTSNEDDDDDDSDFEVDGETADEDEVESLEDHHNDDDEVFKLYFTFLMSSDSGRKNDRDAKGHVTQIKNILSVIDDKKKRGLSSLFNSHLIRDTFLKNHADKKYKASTIKAYINSLKHFYKFTMIEQPPALKSVDKGVIMVMQERIKMWSSSYKKDTCKQHHDKMNDDLEKIITSGDIKKFESSQVARGVISSLGSYSFYSLIVIIYIILFSIVIFF